MYDYDYCYECSAYGDDCYIDESGDLVSVCEDCPRNETNWEE